ncbi:hypothetical protein [Bradyrhizobium sp. SZCCHNR1051]|uniref:hypothetical protein n=1 Tax=Bradyrhizobium sp. SZCCHNR1051 TaxID=3057355 RepID=UPI0029164F07|nr:hypothetical protein [Bradyrhizobium sp. SZCCHNR1051]
MSNNLSAVRSSEEIETLARDAVADARAERREQALQKLAPLRKAQTCQREAAMALLWVVDHICLPRDVAAGILMEIAQSHDEDADILAREAARTTGRHRPLRPAGM